MATREPGVDQPAKREEIAETLKEYQRLEANRKLVKYAVDEEGAVIASTARFDPGTGDLVGSESRHVDLADLLKQREAHIEAISLLDEEIAAIESVVVSKGE